MLKEGKKLAPIALFVYSRPEHTRRTLRRLKANDLARESELFIFADGPQKNASEETLQGIKETRQVIREEQWCGKVHLVELDVNKGIGDNITSGVTELCASHGMVIVLEDDLELGKGFLTYMNEALRIYQNDEDIKHITGYMYPIDTGVADTLFLRITLCWGWATWQRAWNGFTNDHHQLYEEMKRLSFPDDYNVHPSSGFLGMLKGNVMGDGPYNWDINWFTHIYLEKGLCLLPGKSLVRNIGHDGTGLHCGVNEELLYQETVDYIPVKRIEKKQNMTVYNLISGYFARQQYNLKNRIWRRVYKAIGKNY